MVRWFGLRVKLGRGGERESRRFGGAGERRVSWHGFSMWFIKRSLRGMLEIAFINIVNIFVNALYI